VRRLAQVLAALGLLGGCQADLDAAAAPADLDEAFFRCRVQPVLTKYCATFACHGDARRPYRLFARNRLRYGGTESDRNAFLRVAEQEANFAATVAFVDPARPDESLLTSKPLEEAAGGSFHRGAKIFRMGDVFVDAEDRELAVLREWTLGAMEDPLCVEPGSDQ
jgi:hypothetical protein